MRSFLFLFGALGLAFVGAAACGDTFSAPGTGGEGGTNVGRPCKTVDECLAPSSPCVNVTCQVNECVETALGDGPLPASQQTPGDCHKLTCQNGILEDVVDAADLPNDGKECTADVCDEGMASNPIKPTDTPCGEGGSLKCDAAGNCAGCETAADCGTGGVCYGYVCQADKTCKADPVPNGTALDPSHQVPGDCQTLVCNGNGDSTSVVDDEDVPNTPDNSCVLNTCVNGTPDQGPITDGNYCAGSTNRVCCMNVCCDAGDTCSGQGCLAGTGGAGGGN